MNWFYAQNGQQAGPVDDAELDRLVQTGVVADATLVWHSGLPNWQPYAAARGIPSNLPVPGSPVSLGKAGPGQAQCTQCGRILLADEVVKIENQDVCAECKPLFLQRLREGSFVSSAAVYAGFWIRLGAAFLDFLILIPFYLAVGVGFFFFVFQGGSNVDFTSPRFALSFQASFGLLGKLIVYFFQTLYSAFCVSRFGGTPGKRICKLRVVGGLENGPVSFGRALVRYATKVIPRFIPFVGLLYLLVDALFIAFDEQKRGLHDLLAGTHVVHDDPLRWPTGPVVNRPVNSND